MLYAKISAQFDLQDKNCINDAFPFLFIIFVLDERFKIREAKIYLILQITK